jgi:hypothetical protein
VFPFETEDLIRGPTDKNEFSFHGNSMPCIHPNRYQKDVAKIFSKKIGQKGPVGGE